MRIALVCLFACGGSGPAPKPPEKLPVFRADATLEVASEDVSFDAAGHAVPGTLVRPKVAGRWPAILIMAGSGPTDRDWNNPLTPGTNGSAAQLAGELAKRGAVVLRFDKAGAGANPIPTSGWSLDTYRDEGLAALALLRARADVRGDRVFVAGHSEGGLHATRLAAIAQPPFAGVIYLSSSSRTLGDTIVAQIDARLRVPAAMLSDKAVEQEVGAFRQAVADIVAGRPVDPATGPRMPALQNMIASFTAPVQAVLIRQLLAFDNAAEAAKLSGPFYIAAGGKDIQVSPELDGKRLEKALAGKDVTFHLSPDADHVFKHEARTLDEALKEPGKYSEAGRELDADFVTALVAWIAARAP